MKLRYAIKNGSGSLGFHLVISKGGMLRMQEIIKAVAVGIFTIVMAVIKQYDEK